jgi:hypothetical protein
MNINARTGNGWTDAEEATFADIMRIARVGRIGAIQLFRRCRSNGATAVRLARDNYGLTDAQVASFESTKAARLAGLAKARQRAAQNRRFQLSELVA